MKNGFRLCVPVLGVLMIMVGCNNTKDDPDSAVAVEEVMEETTVIEPEEATADTVSDELSAMSVADLLSAPVYGETVTIYGVVSEKGMINSTCFTVTSGGESLRAWYDLMYDPETETVRDSVDVEAIQNGDTIRITGELRPDELDYPPFWMESYEMIESAQSE